jgi:ABC-type multidrug transport system fused ATPase/permease subunit
LANARTADHIVVLDGGRVAQRGKHDELMSIPDGRYRELFDIQAAAYGTG